MCVVSQCVLYHHVCVQHASCLAYFPAPLPLPGFYETSLIDFTSCVPEDACPGIDVESVSTLFTKLLARETQEDAQILAALQQAFLDVGANFSSNSVSAPFPTSASWTAVPCARRPWVSHVDVTFL
jgi:hypothetical protein